MRAQARGGTSKLCSWKGIGVAVGVGDGTGVGVSVGSGVGVSLGRGTGVQVGVGLEVAVAVPVEVLVAVAVWVGAGSSVEGAGVKLGRTTWAAAAGGKRVEAGVAAAAGCPREATSATADKTT